MTASGSISVDQICNFLRSRMVSVDVINNFRTQKIDGKVVIMMDDDDLKALGLTAIGDILSLKDFSKKVPNCSDFKDKRQERKKELLSILRKDITEQSIGNKISRTVVKNPKAVGRPKKATKSVQFGLKLKSDSEEEPKMIKSPLGDKNLISLDIVRTDTYESILTAVSEAFFPDGKNDLVGNMIDFSFDIVNIRNQVIREDLSTLDNYLSCKKIPGVPRMYLLCTPYEDSASDILNNSIYPTSPIKGLEEEGEREEVLGSPSGEIIFRPTYKETSIKDNIDNYILLENDAMDDFSQRDEESQLYFMVDDKDTCASFHQAIPDMNNDHTGFLQYLDKENEPLNLSDSLCNDSFRELQPEMNPTDAVKVCIQKSQNTDDPVEILRIYQKVFLKGRQLEQENEITPLGDGDTASIFVSRQELFETGITELIETPLGDLQKPLEVTFYGEEASDSGGPRKEYFTVMMREFVKEENKLFVESSNGFKLTCHRSVLEKKHYFGAALLCGLSLIENGPLPTFIDADELITIISGKNLTEAQEQFHNGFKTLGLIDLIDAKPTFKMLLKSPINSLTVKKLIHILAVQFSAVGSNRRIAEELSYKLFLKYLKEVAAGRRGNLQLEDILKFVTGSPQEPVLGYTFKPSLIFVPEGPSVLPTSSTCTNLLKIPLNKMPENQLYDLYDISFSSDYFGIV